jgi:lipopolysaccharide/colanic/teichoic acid biosynthesis glycosyltransferase
MRFPFPTPSKPERPARASRTYGGLKRRVEWVAALVLLLAAAPVLAVLAVVLRVSSRGPAFYTQVRLGERGRRFRIYKLRTMEQGCERTTGPVWAVNDDPRTTRIGRWLRTTHLDEVPQLWNVLRGEMALIGPRPERPEIAEQIARVLPAFSARLDARPGLSGLAQLLLPPDADLDSVRSKLAFDLEYIRRMGPALDLRILVATVLHLAGIGRLVRERLLAPYAAVAPVSAPTGAPLLRLTVADSRPRVPIQAGLEGLSKAA